MQYVFVVLSADAVQAYKRSRHPGQSQNTSSAPAISNADVSSDRIVKSVVSIHCRWCFENILPKMPHVAEMSATVQQDVLCDV